MMHDHPHYQGMISRLISIPCAALLLAVLIVLFPPYSQARAYELVCTEHTISATLTELPLKEALQSIQQHTGLWYRGTETLLTEPVSVQFTELPLEAGLKRILTSLNYSLVFTSNGRVAGVVLLGKRQVSGAPAPKRISPMKIEKPAPSQEDLDEALRVVEDIPPPGGPTTISDEEREDLTVVTMPLPPGGAVEMTAEEREGLEVMESAPPGGPAEMTEQDREDLEVVEKLSEPEI
jgi:hypothetical protein